MTPSFVGGMRDDCKRPNCRRRQFRCFCTAVSQGKGTDEKMLVDAKEMITPGARHCQLMCIEVAVGLRELPLIEAVLYPNPFLRGGAGRNERNRLDSAWCGILDVAHMVIQKLLPGRPSMIAPDRPILAKGVETVLPRRGPDA
jgi:hypothetical protein